MTSPDLPVLPDGGVPGLLDGTVPPGVYRTPVVGPEALLFAQAADWYGTVLDLTDVTDKEGFLRACVTGLELPPHHADTWDALTDTLTDLSWLGSPRGFLVLTSGWPGFEAADSADAVEVAGILAAAAGFWAVRDTPFAAVLG